MLKNFRCYNRALEFYDLCAQLRVPPHLTDQLLRASSSVALNLAEGSSRYSVKERRRFYYIAKASLRECEAIFDLVKVEKDCLIRRILDQLGAEIYRLVMALADDKKFWP